MLFGRGSFFFFQFVCWFTDYFIHLNWGGKEEHVGDSGGGGRRVVVGDGGCNVDLMPPCRYAPVVDFYRFRAITPLRPD